MPNQNLDVITVIQPNSSIWPLTPKDLWKWRGAFFRLITKEFQVRFRNTSLGFVWVVLQPLLVLAIFSIAFARPENLGMTTVPYSVYMLSGLVFWTFISTGFIQASMSLIENRALIVQTNLKRILIPLSILSSKLIDLVFGFIFLSIWIVFDPRVSVSPRIVLLPFDIFGILLVLMGTTFAFSALCIRFKDVRYIIPFLAQALFFATPILYAVPDSPYAWILTLNPITTFMLAVRDHILGTNFSSAQNYLLAYLFSLAIFAAGGIIFRKFERSFADII